MGKAHYQGQDVTAVRSPHRPLLPDTVGPEPQTPTSLRGIANKANADQRHRWRDLSRCLDAALVLACGQDLKKAAASGVDHVPAAAYAANLQGNSEAWVPRRNTTRSRAKLVRRGSMPTANGTARPRGMPALADQRVPLACATLLTASYAPDLLDCRDG